MNKPTDDNDIQNAVPAQGSEPAADDFDAQFYNLLHQANDIMTGKQPVTSAPTTNPVPEAVKTTDTAPQADDTTELQRRLMESLRQVLATAEKPSAPEVASEPAPAPAKEFPLDALSELANAGKPVQQPVLTEEIPVPSAQAAIVEPQTPATEAPASDNTDDVSEKKPADMALADMEKTMAAAVNFILANKAAAPTAYMDTLQATRFIKSAVDKARHSGRFLDVRIALNTAVEKILSPALQVVADVDSLRADADALRATMLDAKNEWLRTDALQSGVIQQQDKALTNPVLYFVTDNMPKAADADTNATRAQENFLEAVTSEILDSVLKMPHVTHALGALKAATANKPFAKLRKDPAQKRAQAALKALVAYTVANLEAHAQQNWPEVERTAGLGEQALQNLTAAGRRAALDFKPAVKNQRKAAKRATVQAEAPAPQPENAAAEETVQPPVSERAERIRAFDAALAAGMPESTPPVETNIAGMRELLQRAAEKARAEAETFDAPAALPAWMRRDASPAPQVETPEPETSEPETPKAPEIVVQTRTADDILSAIDHQNLIRTLTDIEAELKATQPESAMLAPLTHVIDVISDSGTTANLSGELASLENLGFFKTLSDAETLADIKRTPQFLDNGVTTLSTEEAADALTQKLAAIATNANSFIALSDDATYNTVHQGLSDLTIAAHRLGHPWQSGGNDITDAGQYALALRDLDEKTAVLDAISGHVRQNARPDQSANAQAMQDMIDDARQGVDTLTTSLSHRWPFFSRAWEGIRKDLWQTGTVKLRAPAANVARAMAEMEADLRMSPEALQIMAGIRHGFDNPKSGLFSRSPALLATRKMLKAYAEGQPGTAVKSVWTLADIGTPQIIAIEQQPEPVAEPAAESVAEPETPDVADKKVSRLARLRDFIARGVEHDMQGLRAMRDATKARRELDARREAERQAAAAEAAALPEEPMAGPVDDTEEETVKRSLTARIGEKIKPVAAYAIGAVSTSAAFVTAATKSFAERWPTIVIAGATGMAVKGALIGVTASTVGPVVAAAAAGMVLSGVFINRLNENYSALRAIDKTEPLDIPAKRLARMTKTGMRAFGKTLADTIKRDTWTDIGHAFTKSPKAFADAYRNMRTENAALKAETGKGLGFFGKFKSLGASLSGNRDFKNLMGILAGGLGGALGAYYADDIKAGIHRPENHLFGGKTVTAAAPLISGHTGAPNIDDVQKALNGTPTPAPAAPKAVEVEFVRPNAAAGATAPAEPVKIKIGGSAPADAATPPAAKLPETLDQAIAQAVDDHAKVKVFVENSPAVQDMIEQTQKLIEGGIIKKPADVKLFEGLIEKTQAGDLRALNELRSNISEGGVFHGDTLHRIKGMPIDRLHDGLAAKATADVNDFLGKDRVTFQNKSFARAQAVNTTYGTAKPHAAAATPHKPVDVKLPQDRPFQLQPDVSGPVPPEVQPEKPILDKIGDMGTKAWNGTTGFFRDTFNNISADEIPPADGTPLDLRPDSALSRPELVQRYIERIHAGKTQGIVTDAQLDHIAKQAMDVSKPEQAARAMRSLKMLTPETRPAAPRP